MDVSERCTTADCSRKASRRVFIEDAEPPAEHPYCATCADMLEGKREVSLHHLRGAVSASDYEAWVAERRMLREALAEHGETDERLAERYAALKAGRPSPTRGAA